MSALTTAFVVSAYEHPGHVGPPMTREDYPHLVASFCLFGRRFDPAVDEEVLDVVDQHLLADPVANG
jgi:hypothetical protein